MCGHSSSGGEFALLSIPPSPFCPTSRNGFLGEERGRRNESGVLGGRRNERNDRRSKTVNEARLDACQTPSSLLGPADVTDGVPATANHL